MPIGYNCSMTSDNPSSRREFLQGRSAARALAERARQAIEAVAGSSRPRPATRNQVAHLHISRPAMACEFEVQLHAAHGPEATDAALAALDLIEQLEDQLSIYRETTEVAAINRTAAAGPVVVEKQLYQLLSLCRRLAAQTSGAFDITSGPLSQVWGFLRRAGRMPSDDEIMNALALVGSEQWELSDDVLAIEFLADNVAINFNSIGKGYALDRAGELLVQRGVGDFLWHAGRSSLLARGANANDPSRGWTVGIRHPHQPEQRLVEFHLQNQGMGTAGSATQFFEHEGQQFGHVIDPRTGRPASGVFTATAIAPTAAEADALATAFYVLGPAGTAEYCDQHRAAAAVLVCPDHAGSDVELHAFNLRDDQWTRLPPPV